MKKKRAQGINAAILEIGRDVAGKMIHSHMGKGPTAFIDLPGLIAEAVFTGVHIGAALDERTGDRVTQANRTMHPTGPDVSGLYAGALSDALK